MALDHIFEGQLRRREQICLTCSQPCQLVCSGCRSVFYCSRPCQAADFHLHKMLCGHLAQHLPLSPGHHLAILFPVDEERPRWTSHRFPEIGAQSHEKSSDVDRSLCRLQGAEQALHYTYIDTNEPRGVKLAVDIEVISYRARARADDGETPGQINKSLCHALKEAGIESPEATPFRGPVLIRRKAKYSCWLENVTLTEFRHFIDYAGSPRCDPWATLAKLPKVSLDEDYVLGVKVLCHGEAPDNGRLKSSCFLSVPVPTDHPILDKPDCKAKGFVSVVSKLVGFPLRFLHLPNDNDGPQLTPSQDSLLPTPRSSEVPCAGSSSPTHTPPIPAAREDKLLTEEATVPPHLDNRAVAHMNPPLLVENHSIFRDLEQMTQAAENRWERQAGNVLVVRADGNDLTVKDLQGFHAFCLLVVWDAVLKANRLCEEQRKVGPRWVSSARSAKLWDDVFQVVTEDRMLEAFDWLGLKRPF